MHYNWIFFDCFNTLIDDFDKTGDESGLGSLPALIVDMGLFPAARDFLSAYANIRQASIADGREITLPERLTRVLKSGTTLSDERVTRVVAGMMEHWQREYLTILRPTPGVREMLAHCHRRKRLCVVSNFFVPHLPAQFLESFGLRRYFDFILDSAAFGFKKPDPRIFYRALELARLTPQHAERVLFVGDRLDLDIYPAKALGMQALYFNRRRSRPAVDPSPAAVPAIYDWKDFRLSPVDLV
jgi:HAD superfamily hydrolase (TIGR01509 family)